MAEIILFIVLLIPVYLMLLWTYFYPEESILFGAKWRYKGDLEPSEVAVRYTKFVSLLSLIGIPLFLIMFLFELYFLLVAVIALIVIYVLGTMKIFTDD